MDTILSNLLHATEESGIWLRGVLLGEWEQEKTVDQMVANAVAGFIPGIGMVMTLSDLIAIIVRLARHPERREDVEEWILLAAMLLPLLLTALGALAAGVGALVGAELGGFIRAVMLFLLKKGGVSLKAMVEFFRAHGYGDVIQALRDIHFPQYSQALVKEFDQQMARMHRLLSKLEQRLQQWDRLPSWLQPAALPEYLRRLRAFTEQLKSLAERGHDMLPKALLELDRRLKNLLAGDIRAAITTRHTIHTGVAAPAVAKLKQTTSKGQTAMNMAADSHPGSAHIEADPGVLHNPDIPEPGNTRRVPERRIAQHFVDREKQQFRLVDAEGMPVGAKPYKAGETVVEHTQLKEKSWVMNHSSAVNEGYPDLAALNHQGRASANYKNFEALQKLKARPGQKFVRVIAHDAEPRSDYGPWWTHELPASGEQLRSSTAVKEDWNKDGSYIEMTTPPAGHPVWQELGISDEVLRGWEGPASSQIYEYIPKHSTQWIPDNFYLPGGGQQIYFEPKQLELLKEHGLISERRPTGFHDYHPDYINTDGSQGNILPSGDIIFEQIPLHQAQAGPKGAPEP